MHPFALHYALVSAGDPFATEVQRVCAEGRVEICRFPVPANKQKPGQTLAVGTIAQCVRAYGSDIAIAALQCLQSVYHDRAGMLRAAPIRAVAYMLNAGTPPVKIRRVLAAHKAEEIAHDVFAWGRKAQCAEWHAYRGVIQAHIDGREPVFVQKSVTEEIREMIEGSTETLQQIVRRRCEGCGATFATQKLNQLKCKTCAP
jgi:hypothetical protein